MQSRYPIILSNPILFPLSVLAGSLYALSSLLLFYTSFIDFYLDISIVTNDRIIDIEQSGLFSRRISELDLFRIQDVTSQEQGVLSTFLDYGTVTVKTASNNSHIVFFNVPQPNEVRDELIRLSHEDRKYHNVQAG